MIDVVYALDKLGLQPGMSVSRAIHTVGLKIDESSDPLRTANKIITSLGAKPVSNTIMANVLAKALIEQAILSGTSYDAEKAVAVAAEKYLKIERTMPYIFAGSGEGSTPVLNTPVRSGTKKASSNKSNDKKTQALEIYNRESGKGLTGTAVAKIIADELKITVANAQYYVTRVFNKYK
mgnify:CR=1 FL=1|jgi:hypothetical protein